MMSEHSQNPDVVFPIDGDVYRLHHRPSYPHIIINDDYQGIKVFDPLRKAIITERAFPEGYSSTGIIDHWFFSADGRKLLTVCEEDRSIALIDLVEEQGSSLVEYPPIDLIGSAAYIWDEVFVFVSGMVSRYFALEQQNNSYSFVEKRSIDIRLKYSGWRRAVDQVYANKWSVERVDSKEKTLFYHDHHSQPHQVGILNWQTNEHFSARIDENIPKFASDGRRVFALKEYLLQISDSNGELVSRFEPEVGFHFLDIDILAVDKKTVLVLLISSLSENNSRLLAYSFEG